MSAETSRIFQLGLDHNMLFLQVTDTDFGQHLAKALGLAPCRLLSEVADYVASELKATVALIEKEYVDADYLCDYVTFYGRSFRPPKPKCARVHFFQDALGPGDLLALEKQQNSYLGYAIVRPTGYRLISRTCLQVPHRRADVEYVLCKHAFEASVNGTALKVEAFPFITQDTNTFVCAGAAMWMQAFYMHERYGFPRYYPAQITDIARRYSVGGHVRSGLRPREMATALRDMGFNPHVYRFDLKELSARERELTVRDATLTAHAIVESRLPCIFGVFGKHPFEPGQRVAHAITAIGHSFESPDEARLNKLRNADAAPYGKGFYNGDWVTWFVVNDDQRKPYRRIWVWKRGKDAEAQDYCLSDLDSLVLVVPMPREVSMEFAHAVDHARPAFQWWNNFITKCAACTDQQSKSLCAGQKVSLDWLLPQGEMNDLVLRVYLDRGEEFKQWVEKTGMHADYKMIYRAMSLPKYVWVVQMATKDRLNEPEEDQRLIRGEIVLDSTANPFGQQKALLAFHYGARFAWQGGDTHCPRVLFRADEPSEYHPGQRGAERVGGLTQAAPAERNGACVHVAG